MKINRLTSIEVANISVLPFSKRRQELLKIEDPNVYWGYTPVVNALPKLLLAEAPLFGHLPRGSDAALLETIKRACKSGPSQISACTAVAQAIIDWRNSHAVTGRIVSPEPLRMSVDTLRYCADVAAIKDQTAYVLHIDPRSSMTLSKKGTEFIKSLIHHTALVGDLRDAKAAILRVPNVGKGQRKAIFEVLEGDPSFSLDEILKSVSETYSIWETILRARRASSAEGRQA